MEQRTSQPSSENMISQILSMDLFKTFDPSILESALGDLEAELRWVHLAAGETLFRQGDAGDSLYILTRGRLRVQIEHPDGTTQVLDELSPRTTVGEMALMTGQPRNATISAVQDSELVQLSKEGFDRLAEKYPEAMTRFAQVMVPRMRERQLAGVLANLFGSLGPSALDEVDTALEWRHLRNGEAIFRQGDSGDALYIVVSGRLAIVVEDADGNKHLVGEVSSGESVGELAFLTGEARSATAYAIRDTDVVKFSKDAFDRLLEQYPQAMMQITRIIIKRIQQPRTAPGQGGTVATIAVVPASRDVPLPDFAQRLAQALARFGPTLHLNSEHFDRLIGRPGLAQTPEDHPLRVTLVDWLSDQETKYRYIVYEADPGWSPWTSRCVRQADRVLILGRSGADPSPGEIETEMRRLQAMAREELVLLHPPGTRRPVGTREWLNRRKVFTHHHVRLDVDGDILRLTRRLTGRALGLVLGGGGARGLSHIGVIRALEEAGLQVDLVGGTSIGGFVGACYAMGMDHHAMTNVARAFGARKQVFDYTVPLVSFLASKKVTSVLQKTFGNVYIEDLWRPFFCVSSNLTTAKAVVHRQGLLWKYVRATISLPAIFSPILDNGELLVDGAVMNNLPIDIMRDLSEGGPVVAVNVSPELDLGTGYEFGTSISGWQVLWSKLNPFGRPLKVPSLAASILRAAELNDVNRRKVKRALADLFIYPPIEKYSILNFEPFEEIIELGYRTAQPAIQAWLAKAETQSRWGLLDPDQVRAPDYAPGA